MNSARLTRSLGTLLPGMLLLAAAALAVAQPAQCQTQMAFSQPPSPSGGLLQSSWWDPNGSDYDQYVWDNFRFSTDQAITEIGWRGGYDPAYFGSGGPVIDFTVSIWASVNYGKGVST